MKTIRPILLAFLCIAISVAHAEDSPANFREYLDAAAKADKFTGTVLVARRDKLSLSSRRGD
jgi:hypothetical protein